MPPPPVVVTVEYLLELVTGEHNQRPRFMQTVALSVDPYIDGHNTALSYRTLFDLDTATGEQLDFVGQWVGITRYIIEPIHFFTLDKEDWGFNEAEWITAYDQTEKLIKLDDEHYRFLLRARIVANHWDGTIEGAYSMWDMLFAGTDWKVLIQDGFARSEYFFEFDDIYKGLRGFDMAGFAPGPQHTFLNKKLNGDMTIIMALIGPRFDYIVQALFAGGYFGLDSAGVGSTYVMQNQTPGPDDGVGKPLFAFDAGPSVRDLFVAHDADTQGHDEALLYSPPYDLTRLPPGITPHYPPYALAGFDMGCWAKQIEARVPLADQPPIQDAA